MFTGIVEEIGKVVSARADKLVVSADKVLRGMELGGSIAVNGVCLTVTDFDSSTFSTGLMPETLKRTNLGLLSPGREVNLERPVVVGGMLGGHLLQGHVDDTGRVTSVSWEGEAKLITIETSPQAMRYIVEKGFTAVDGISLTVVTRNERSFQVSVVEFTREHTTLGSRRVGDLVNLEVDIVAKYVEQLGRPSGSGVTVDFLQEHGFLAG